MQLVFIYGAPATGKLTVAREVADLTGFRLFHNHLSADLVSSVFDFGSEAYTRYCRKLRLQIFEAAAIERVAGLVFTFCYANPADNEFVLEVIRLIERNQGDISFVRLYCEPQVSEERVVSNTRKGLGKITTVEKLRDKIERWNFFSAIPFRDSLRIDSSHVDPVVIAAEIVNHYGLLDLSNSEVHVN